MAKKQSKVINIFYWIGELVNIGSIIALIYLIFYAPINEINIRIGLFLLWINLTTHITSRTKNIQSDEEIR